MCHVFSGVDNGNPTLSVLIYLEGLLSFGSASISER